VVWELNSYFYYIILTMKVLSMFFSFISDKIIVYGDMQKMSLSFKVDPRLKKALEDQAIEENRSLSNYVVTLLIKHLEEKSIDWKKKPKS